MPNCAPFGEGRRDVGVDAGGIDFALERADRLRVFGYDRLAVLRGVAGDVGERLVDDETTVRIERRRERNSVPKLAASAARSSAAG